MNRQMKKENGVSVVIVAAGLTVFLGFLALVIDLGMLYSARSDAQKAADAAALAGAKYFIDQGSLPSSLTQTLRDRSKALTKAIGGENKVRGISIQPADVVVNDSDIQLLNTTNGPVFQVTAQVQKTGLSTFFAPILGITSVNVAASATAQASLPTGSSGGTPPSYNPGANCIKPWIVQNISPRTIDPKNPIPFGPQDKGRTLLLHDDQSTNGPSKWGITAPCPTYTTPPNEPCDGGNSSTTYYDNIVTCNPNTYYCSTSITINDVPGNKVGKTQDGVRTLIHQGGGKQSEGTDQGQDTIALTNIGDPVNFNYSITGGSNNPIPGLPGKSNLTQSDSIIIIPFTNSPPPSNGQLKIPIDGHLKLFITQIHPPNAKPKEVKNQIDTVILDITTCLPSSAGGGGNGQPYVTGNAGGTAILRLVR